MRLDSEQVQALKDQGTTVAVTLNGAAVDPAILVMADDEAGIIECFLGSTAETQRIRGVVKIRLIKGLGVSVHESIKAGDGL